MPIRKLHSLTMIVSLVLLTSCGHPLTSTPLAVGASARAAAHAVARSFDRLPLYFIQNRGQTDARVAFYVPGRDQTLYFTPDGLTFAFTTALTPTSSAPLPAARARDDALLGRATPAPAPRARQRWSVKLDFVGANPNARPVGEAKTQAVFSYFKGQPNQWQAGLPGYSQLRYPDLWPGIDLVYSGLVNQLKYEFVVQPGADPALIQLAYRGASAVRLAPDGQLEVATPLGGFRDAAPVAYQVKNGQRVPVEMRYTLSAPVSAGQAARYEYSFHLGPYDASLPLVLDPAVLVYAGYIGGVGDDYGTGIAIDGAGNAYVTGVTYSNQTSFPVTVGPDLTFNGTSGDSDAFVAKVNAAGTGLVYAGYIGGSGPDVGTGIAVDGAGNAYVTGWTSSNQTTFPVTVGPDLTYNGGGDAFVAKVNATGTALVYAGYIGGSSGDEGHGIAVDGAGNAYVTGETGSDQTTFPVTTGPDLTFHGGALAYGGDAFVAKVNAVGTALVYAGYIGTYDDDIGSGIAVDKNGNAYVIGSTCPLPLSACIAFVAKVNAGGTALAYTRNIVGTSAYRPGIGGSGIAVDKDGNAYITGYTGSALSETNRPALGYNGGAYDAFVAKVNAAGTALVYVAYIGGSGDDLGTGIAVDKDGNAYVTGSTTSDQTTFPVKVGPDLTYNGGTDSGDAFVAKVNAAGAGLVYAGYIGGAGDDYGSGIALDGAGNAYVTGWTASDQTTFPVLAGPDLTYNGGGDAFVAKVSTAHIWTGALDTDWNKPGNWSPSGVPAAGDGSDCVLPAGLTHYPSVSGAGIGCAGTLTIADGAQFTTDGVNYNFGQEVTVDGTWQASNAFDSHGTNTDVNVNSGGRLLLTNASIGNFSAVTTTVNAIYVTGLVQISGTVTVHHGTSLVINPFGRVTLPAGAALEVQDAGTLTNNGTLEQVNLVTGPTEFLHITDGGSTDKYFGLVITPTAGSLLTTTVSLQGNQSCTTLTVARCYAITPSSVNPATIAFYYSAGEANGNTAPNAYHWNGTSWEALGSTRGGSGLGLFVVATGVTSYSPFALKDSLPSGVPYVYLFLPVIRR